jgi:acetyl-CoA acyltransferase
MGRLPFAAEAEIQERFGQPWGEQFLDRYQLVPQGVAAERIAKSWDISRTEMDEVSAESHRRAARAWETGAFASEVIPVLTADGAVTSDQGIRPATTPSVLANLPAAFTQEGSVTAGNSSQVSDGAAALLLADRRLADKLGLPYHSRIIDHVAVGVDPVIMLEGPVPATMRLLKRNGLGVSDIDRYEVNEAFAAVLCMWARALDADLATVNVNGGAIALGHPLGASGARLSATLVHEMDRSESRLGVVTMCCRGGLGTATLFERVR